MEETERGIEHKEKIYILLIGIFVGGLVIAGVLASKIVNVAGLMVPGGVLAYSITFPITDVICEVWGKKRGKYVVFSGFITLLVALGLIRLTLVFPKAPFWTGEEAFARILGSTSRIIIASFIAYLVSQYHDVWAFHFWRKITKGRYLWLRNNASTFVSQFIDTAVFIIIAFYGVMPIFTLIKGQYIIKLMIALLDTPLVYFGVWLIRRGERNEDRYSRSSPAGNLR
ncbi:queuosine precursor transporter [bacterium]|nr:queuosine precursor transporter [bacterium]NIN91455.1 queuosine precursor transporter [bacterium]NIO17865.1 queuosine precursor transporter [bacterium]NIO72846.1 queuosine precursor transporter [bacterium]